MKKDPLYENAHRRTVRDTQEEMERGHGHIRSYGGTTSHMTVVWDKDNPEIKRHGLVRLVVGKEQVIIDPEQLHKFLRWV